MVRDSLFLYININKKILSAISPTFSIPSARQYFEISTDNGATYDSASLITLQYLDITKMQNYTPQSNPLSLKFRKKSNVTDTHDYRITKILVNQASTIVPKPGAGDNVVNIGSQDSDGIHAAGNYATYNNVNNGGINFSNFKMASIQNTNMQLVFFVAPMNGMDVPITYEGINLESGSKWFKSEINGRPSSITLNPNTKKITIITSVPGFETNCNISDTDFGFTYSLTFNNCFQTRSVIGEYGTRGEIAWEIDIDEIIWTDNPKIIFSFLSVDAYGTYDEDYGKLKLDENYHYPYDRPNGEIKTFERGYNGEQEYDDSQDGIWYHMRFTDDWININPNNDKDLGPVKTDIHFEY